MQGAYCSTLRIAEFNLITDGYHGLGTDTQPWDPLKPAGRLGKGQLKNENPKKNNSNDNSFE